MTSQRKPREGDTVIASGQLEGGTMSLWRVIWEQPAAGPGHDVVEAASGYHAVWYIASDYAQKGITDLTFVKVEPIAGESGQLEEQ